MVILGARSTVPAVKIRSPPLRGGGGIRKVRGHFKPLFGAGNSDPAKILLLKIWTSQMSSRIFGFRLSLSGIKGVEAGGSAPVSKEYGKSQPLRATICLSLSRYRLNRLTILPTGGQDTRNQQGPPCPVN